MSLPIGMNIWTWANLLTAFRLAVSLPSAWSIFHHHWYWASVLFVLAVLSDVFDGMVARRLEQTSPLGGLLDHSSDAVFVICALAAFALLDRLSPLLPVLIALSFVQYVLDSRALQGKHLRMSFLGRWNGIAYFVLLGIGIFGELVSPIWPSWPGTLMVQVIAWVLVATTFASMLDRAITWLGSEPTD